jgi:hypothetical protein
MSIVSGKLNTFIMFLGKGAGPIPLNGIKKEEKSLEKSLLLVFDGT